LLGGRDRRRGFKIIHRKTKWRLNADRMLRTTIAQLRHELRTKQTALGGLELALQARHETIDALNARLEQSREQCRRLDQECENYFRMLAAG
jgi:hypothetical protein